MTSALTPPGDPTLAPHLADARRLARHAVAVLLLGFVPVAGWLAWAPLSSAVIAPAFVKVDLERRPVQHAEGGLVREVLVRDGQQVTLGQPLLVLGDVAVDADVHRLHGRVMSERASLARLEAEQAALPQLQFPADLQGASQGDPRLAEQMLKEQALFGARRDTLTTQLALLQDQRAKVLQEVGALRGQIERAGEALRLQKAELDNHVQLQKDGFISTNRVSQLQATVADYGVKLEERRADLARAQQRLTDIDLRMQALRGEYRKEASDQLKVTAARLAEIEQELRKATDAARRQVITAPVAGEVMNLRITGAGTVVPPRETVADIVPRDPRLVIEARVRTEDVAQVRRGQAADIRLTAFNHRTTPLVEGKVFYVAADRSVDPATQMPYYVALVEAEPASLRRAGEPPLQAGMPAEVFLRGRDRTPLQYLMEPLTDGLRRAGRER